jgi:hypothetical protein
MNLVFSLKILADLCFYMFAISSVTSIPAHSGLLATSPAIAALAAYFSRYLYARFPKKPWLRFSPLLILAGCFLFTAHAADIVVTVPMILYVAFLAFRKLYEVGYDEMLSRLYLCLKLVILPLLIMVIANNWAGFVGVMLPYLFFYLVLTVMLLRMLRHNEKVLSDRRFRLMNVGEILLLCGAGYLLSSGYMLMAFRFLIGLAVRFVLRPVLTGIVYVFGGFAWLLSKIFSGIDFNMEDVDLSQLDDLGQAVQQGEQTAQEYAQNQDNPAIRIMTYVLIGVGALIVVLVVVLLFRALMKAGRRGDDNKFDDVRESLDDPDEGGAHRLTRAPRDRVRHYYRKFLKLCDVRGIGAGEHLNSREINDKVRHIFQTPSLSALRALYIKARYSSAEVTANDVKEARSAYEEVKKSGE